MNLISAWLRLCALCNDQFTCCAAVEYLTEDPCGRIPDNRFRNAAWQMQYGFCGGLDLVD